MQTAWYQKTDTATCSFFEVDFSSGLSQQEALKRLRHFGPNKDPILMDSLQKDILTMVLRQGKRQYIPSTQVVPGDIVVLNVGDRVPADLRLLHVTALVMNQGMITGEPIPVHKNTFAFENKAPLSHQKCMAFTGSFVTSGQGVGVVVERGQATALAQTARKKKRRGGLRGSVIARRLKRYGVYVINKSVLSRFRRVTHVIVDDALTDTEILDIVRKVQLTRNIHCRFIVTESQAARLSTEMASGIYDASSRTGDLHSALFIVNLHTDTDNSLHIVKALEQKDTTILWASNGLKHSLGALAANITLVVGRAGRADMILNSDLFAPKVNSTLLTRILYNKK